jgi:hypothetical protein
VSAGGTKSRHTLPIDEPQFWPTMQLSAERIAEYSIIPEMSEEEPSRPVIRCSVTIMRKMFIDWLPGTTIIFG